MVEYLVMWTVSTGVGDFVLDHPWMFPAGETLHFMGLSLLVGTVGMVDLRMLGLAKRVPFAPLHQLLGWGIAGFVTCLLTGIMFWFVNPGTYAVDVGPIFGLKLLFILLGGINVLVFRLTVFREVMALGPGESAPLLAKVIAGVSLLLWMGVIWWGRMLMFT
jgi:hypothetical protein